jgi:hypothetical protein
MELPLMPDEAGLDHAQQRVHELLQVQVPGFSPATAAGHIQCIINQLTAAAAVSGLTSCAVASCLKGDERKA